MIENLATLINKHYGNKKSIDTISNHSKSVEEVKARVQKIIDSGVMKRKRIKKRKKDDNE